MAALSCVILLAWMALALLHGGFWRVRPFAPSPAPCPELAHWPAVVAVVPARDEAEVLGAALASLLTQDYPGAWHVIVVDDHSSDGTAAVAASTARRLGLERSLTVVRARPLPPGWAGKVWAQAEGMAALAQRFPGSVLTSKQHFSNHYVLLTDADIAHAPSMLRQLVVRAEAEQRVLTSLMVRLRCESKAERALVPAFVFFFKMLYPFDRVKDPGSRTAAAAGGCMLARLDALVAIGGLAAIRGALIDDCALAAAMKRRGPIRLDLADTSRSLRAYGWRGFWNMIARSAYTQLRHSPWRLGGTVAGMLLLYAAPPALLFLLGPGSPAGAIAGAAWLLMAALYCPMLRYYGRPLLQAPALPLVALFYLGATLASAWRHLHGRGGQWKGRSQAPGSKLPP